jgi:hypothetical protein
LAKKYIPNTVKVFEKRLLELERLWGKNDFNITRKTTKIIRMRNK